MKEVRAYLISEYETEPIENDEIYITTEEVLKSHINDAKRVFELADQLSREGHLSYLEKQELKSLSKTVYQKTQIRLEDLYPQYRLASE